MRLSCLGMRLGCLEMRLSCLGMRLSCLGMRLGCLEMRLSCLGMRLGYKPTKTKSVPCVVVLCLALPVVFDSLVGVVTVVGRWGREG